MDPGRPQQIPGIPVDAAVKYESPFAAGAAEVIPATPSEERIQAEVVSQNYALPPGYRFVPDEIELLCEYLEKKIRNLPVPKIGIRDVNLYGRHNPQILAERYPPLGNDEWYFFTPRERKYPNGSRPNRAAGTGYWKATGADKNISLNENVIGYKKTLVFYEGKSPKGVKTNWTMHEFTINQPPRSRRNAQDMRLDDWVLCRISKKDPKPKENQQDKEIDPVDEEEVNNIPVVDNNADNQLPAVGSFRDNVAGIDDPMLPYDDDLACLIDQQHFPSIDFLDTPIVDHNNGDHAVQIGQDRVAALEIPDGLINGLGDICHQPALPDLQPQVPYNSMEGSFFTHFGLDSGNDLRTISYDHGMANPIFGQSQSILQNEVLDEEAAWRLSPEEDLIQKGFWDSGTCGPFFSYSAGPSNSSIFYDSFVKIEDALNDGLQIPDNNNNNNPMMPRKRTRVE